MLVLGVFGLLATFGAVLLFARAALHVAGEPRRAVAYALALMLYAAGPITLCRLTEDLVVATVAFAALCLVGVAALWRRTPAAEPAEVPDARPYGWAIAVAIVALLLVAGAAIRNYLWDEYTGHFPLAAVIARGVAPPQHPYFPGAPFRYHYAYDVLAGVVRAFTGARVEHALDVATIASFAVLLPVSAHVGARLAGRAGASLAVVLVPFGSSLLEYLLLPELGRFELRWSAIPHAWLENVPPPIISNFFQHPQGLGMPLALAVLLLFDGHDRSARGRTARTFVGAVFLGMLSLAQVVFFALTGLGLGVLVLARGLEHRRVKVVAGELLLLALSVPIALGLGGFFSRGDGSSSSDLLVLGRTYFQEPFVRSLLHHLVAFGLPLVLLPLGLGRLRAGERPLRLALFTAALAGFVVPNVVGYERSWDSVKFFGVGGFFANVVLADVLAPLARRHRALLALLVVTTSFVGLFWVTRMSVLDGELGIPKMHFQPPPPIADAVEKALRGKIRPRDRVLSTNMDLGMGGGLLTPGFDWRELGASFILDRPRVDRLLLHRQRARHDLRREDLDGLDVEWVIFSPGDVDALSPEGKAALADPTRFEHVEDVSAGGETRRVYRVLR